MNDKGFVGTISLGEFVRRVREQKGFTYDNFRVPGVLKDVQVVQRLEVHNEMPGEWQMEAIMQCLGFTSAIITKNNVPWNKEVQRLLSRHEVDAAEALIAQQDDIVIQQLTEYDKQSLATNKLAIAIMKKEDPEEIRSIILNELKRSIPSYHEQKIHEYLLTENELQLLLQLAMSYGEYDEQERAIEILFAVIENIDTHNKILPHYNQCFSTILYNMSKYMHEANMFNDAMYLCERGVEVCIKQNDLLVLPMILANKAYCLYDLDEKEKSLAQFREAHSLFNNCNLTQYKIILEVYVNDLFGIDL